MLYLEKRFCQWIKNDLEWYFEWVLKNKMYCLVKQMGQRHLPTETQAVVGTYLLYLHEKIHEFPWKFGSEYNVMEFHGTSLYVSQLP